MSNKILSKKNALHYKWGESCDGWVFIEDENMSVKQERMPAHTSEQLHYHQRARQFFFILKGIATFEIEDRTLEVKVNEGLHIDAGKKHRIMNNCGDDLEFILSSQPTTKGDRINL